MKRVNSILILCFSLLGNALSTQAQVTMSYQDDALRVNYTVENGQFHGPYTSYHSNGQLKTQGTFRHNYRQGTWTLWDSLGAKRMVREYEDHLHFQRTFPPIPNEGPIPILAQPIHEVKVNEDSILAYYHLRERAIVWSKRIWRTLLPTQNNPMLSDPDLLLVMNRAVQDGQITVYKTADDEFRYPLTTREFNYLHLSDDEVHEAAMEDAMVFSKLEILHFKIKEDWVIDSDRQLLEARIIGICPVVSYKGDTLDLYWSYYPELRYVLGKVSVGHPDSRINSLDDVFFYRAFSSSIYKESNVYDRSFADYLPRGDRARESERVEISIIETEHDQWLRTHNY